MQFYITSFSGRCKAEMEKHTGYMNWDVSCQCLSTTESLILYRKMDKLYFLCNFLILKHLKIAQKMLFNAHLLNS